MQRAIFTGRVAACGLAAALVLVVVLFSTGRAVAEEPRTNLEVGESATQVLVTKVATSLPPAGGRLYLQPTASHDFNKSFQDALAPALNDGGYDVWILEPGESPAAGSTLVEYTVLEARVSYPGETRGFLSLGTPTIRRRVVLDLDLKVEDVDTGRVLLDAGPRVQSDDQFDGGDLEAVQADMPVWAGEKISIAKNPESAKSGPFEKLAILGLLGGVVVLYLSGAQ